MHFLLCLIFICGDAESTTIASKQHLAGFFDLYWSESDATLHLKIDRFDEPFLFVSSLKTGLGSNDIGLDRGQLGKGRIVHFKRVGNRVYLIQSNQMYRADTKNLDEQRAVAESFAGSTIWSAEIKEEDEQVFVDLGSLVFSDSKKVEHRLRMARAGSYQLDPDRSYYALSHTKSFPDNTEVEVALTFTGEPKGDLVKDVATDATALTMYHRYSFIRLPDEHYQRRRFHPKSGGFFHRWRDYAAPLDEDLDQLNMVRHRLQLKTLAKGPSEVVEPLTYYIDRGAPEQIRQALMEGAGWWSEAFEEAGLHNAFQVKLLPPDIDPMDIRYNVIQWVHRSTRGWSYGSAVVDPRSGEIIKGHVILGSLRVRQDRLIFEGMLACDQLEKLPTDQQPVELALARIRQLVAHEVGHTLGLSHNFAASTKERASVMDYPAPLIRLKHGKLDTREAYARGIGEWDRLSIRCIYGAFKQDYQEMDHLLRQGEARGLTFVGDSDSRELSTMHPLAHLWDNGANALDEMERVFGLRSHLLKNFSSQNLPSDQVLARLEEVLVPVYLHHRYQLQAVVKSLGGARFDYGYNDGERHFEVVASHAQKRALQLLLATLETDFLEIPDKLRNLIPPRPPGFPIHRELFDRRTSPAFDALALPETSTQITLELLLSPPRLNRIFEQKIDDPGQLGTSAVFDSLLARFKLHPQGRAGLLHRQVNYIVLNNLIELVGNVQLREGVRAQLYYSLHGLTKQLSEDEQQDRDWQAHQLWLRRRLVQLETRDELFQPSRKLKLPPGGPI